MASLIKIYQIAKIKIEIYLIGWGNIDVVNPENPRKIRTLMETELLLVTQEECETLLLNEKIGADDMDDVVICTFGGHTGACSVSKL